MAPRPKPEKKPIFTEAYWKRPEPKDKGDASADIIAMAMGYALSAWEQADQALAMLFAMLADCKDPGSYNAVRRAYGTIESNSGRRNAVMAAAEVYFGAYWENKLVEQSLINIINAVQYASRRRDDIAHGVIWTQITIEGNLRGAFLTPPEYNTGRTHAFPPDADDPFRWMRTKYRYTSEDIRGFITKFLALRTEITAYTGLIQREDGRFPALEAALEPLMDRGGKSR